MLKVKLIRRHDDKASIKDQVDGLCQYLASNPHARMAWADFIGEFRDFDDFLNNAKSTSYFTRLAKKEYADIFIDTFSRDKKNLRYLIGGVPERLVFHLLNTHPDSTGKAEKEVSIKIIIDDKTWSKMKTLDVAFWDKGTNNGRGFECKCAHVSDVQTRIKIFEFLSTIYTLTGGLFETVIFSFCLNGRSFYEALIRQKELSEEEREQLSKIKFIGYEHLPDFDGTTSCVERRVEFGSHEW